MLENYKKYLSFIMPKLDKFFDEQKPYIFCKKGCAKCCKNAEFPFSALEISYLFEGIDRLDIDTQNIITEKIKKINADKDKFAGEKFLYDCPFLINDVCSVYENRGLICRTFGLIWATDNDEKAQLPFCYTENLNYSNVVDFKRNRISQEKCDELGYEKQPHGYNISYNFLTSKDMEEAFKISFGDKKPLVDWFDDIR